MTAAGEILLGIFRQAWTLIAGLLALIAILGGLAQVFKMTGGIMLGSNFWVSEAVSGVLGVILIALVGFLSIPAIVHAASVSGAIGCGPISRNRSICWDVDWWHWFTQNAKRNISCRSEYIDKREWRRFKCAD